MYLNAAKFGPTTKLFRNIVVAVSIVNATCLLKVKFSSQLQLSSAYSKQTSALRQASEESACLLLSFFCDD